MIRKNMVFLWVTALLPLLLCLWFYPQLPELIPTNFNNGEITKYGPKAAIWIIGGLGPVIALLFTLLPMVDPRRRNYDRLGSRYNLLAGGVNLFLLMMTGLIIAESLRPGSLRVENLVFAAIGLLFAMMGNFMPKAGSNFAFGIRNMWTLSSETVWKRTHRMAGKLWFAGGLVLFLLGLGHNMDKVIIGSIIRLGKMALYAPAVAIFLVLELVPTAYSFLLWRQENPSPGH